MLFPDVDVPAGWTATDSGPRRWLLPPGVTSETSGARIVLVPLLARRGSITTKEFLEETLRAELARFPHMRKTEFEPISAAGGMDGLKFVLAILEANPEGRPPVNDDVKEWRAYAAFADARFFYSMFLQAYTEWYERTVGVFWDVARSVRPVTVS
jgi:hypothetical protein